MNAGQACISIATNRMTWDSMPPVMQAHCQGVYELMATRLATFSSITTPSNDPAILKPIERAYFVSSDQTLHVPLEPRLTIKIRGLHRELEALHWNLVYDNAEHIVSCRINLPGGDAPAGAAAADGAAAAAARSSFSWLTVLGWLMMWVAVLALIMALSRLNFRAILMSLLAPSGGGGGPTVVGAMRGGNAL